MALSSELLSILVCPESREALLYFPEGDPQGGGAPFLFCVASRLKYRVDDDIPVMLVDEAERVEPEEAERLAEAAKAGAASG